MVDRLNMKRAIDLKRSASNSAKDNHPRQDFLFNQVSENLFETWRVRFMDECIQFVPDNMDTGNPVQDVLTWMRNRERWNGEMTKVDAQVFDGIGIDALVEMVGGGESHVNSTWHKKKDYLLERLNYFRRYDVDHLLPLSHPIKALIREEWC
eukprot:GHVH01017472.1.p1 GENE.GHVH01017472.1~~GHVH01017472.1.p1  ORF type:complete len:152 (+),score=32.65 GHVH01017472.1:242-697(+)